MVADKKAKYARNHAEANELQFLPFILESTGFIHDEALSFLRRIACVAPEARSIPSGILFNYFLKRLCYDYSVVLRIALIAVWIV